VNGSGHARRALHIGLLCLAACGGDTGTGGGAPSFTDVTEAAGIDFVHVHGGVGRKYLFETMGSGVAAADFDGDELPDLLFLQSGTLPTDEFPLEERGRDDHQVAEGNRLYRNLGDGTFEDVTAGSGLDVPFYAQGLAVGDVDSDGDRDIYVGAYGRSRLFLNDGNARFTDVSETCGIDDPIWTIGGAFLDADGDGDLDLYSVAYLDMPYDTHRFCGPSRQLRTYCHVDGWDGLDDHLWINDGSGHFTDGSAAAGLVGTVGKGLAAVASDLDDDGDLDIFVANDSKANLMLRNEGGGRFAQIGRESGTDYNAEGRSEACMGIDSGDLDGDGDLDLYVVNFQQETNTLYRNDGDMFFTDVATSSGTGVPSTAYLGFGTVFVDVENDGDLDIYVANGHILDNVEEVEKLTSHAQADQLYLNDGSGRFTLAPESNGDALAQLRVGRGVARVDFDRDGDADLVVSNNGGPPWVLRNDLATGHRIVLRLAGPAGRADAEGARVTVRHGDVALVRELSTGSSYASHSDTELLIGLGEMTGAAVSVEIRWPDGTVSNHPHLAVDRRYRIGYGGVGQDDEALPPPRAGTP
jgi:hypothetical protein